MKQIRLMLLIMAIFMPMMVNADPVEIDGIYYNLYNNHIIEAHAEVTQNPSDTESYSGDIVIPEKITYDEVDYDVTTIATNAFYKCSGLTSVTIPNSVTRIDGNAFAYCSGLTSVTIPNSVTSIGWSAFGWCSGLTSVIIPNSVTSIGIYAFSGCSNLTSVTIGSGLTSIDYYSFADCPELTDVYCMSESVLNAKSDAFKGSNIEYATLHVPNSLINDYIKRVPWTYFKGIVKNGLVKHIITYIVDGEEYKKIGIEIGDPIPLLPAPTKEGFIFSGWSEIPKTMPDNDVTVTGTFRNITVTTIIDNIWYKIDKEAGVAEVTRDPSAPNSSDSYLGTIAIPETITFEGNRYSVTSIGEGAFRECSSLTSITIPNSVTSIGSWAFYRCSGLTSVHISDIETWCKISFGGVDSNPLYYAHHLYLDGKEIKDLVIPNSITSIGWNAFSGCSGLTSVTIPNSVVSIEDEAFYGCSGLTSLTIPNRVTTIGGFAFYECSSLTSITIPNSLTSTGECTFEGCSSLTSVHISDLEAWCNISFDDNPLKYAKHLYLNGEEIKDLVIPNNVTSIGYNAFEGGSALTSVTIPNSVTSIDWNAFYGCSGLKSITIGSGVTSVGSRSFSECPELTDVYCMAENVPSTQSNAFYKSNIENATLHVPVGCVDAYKAIEPWKNFKEIIEMEASSVRTVNVATAGTLSTLISDDDKLSITELTITGYLNGTDFRLIREMAGNDYLGRPTNGVLRKLDISGANIVEGGEKYLDIDRVTSIIGKYIQEVGVISYQFVTQNNVLGTAVFAGCDKLEEIALPHSITSIDGYVFIYCLNLKSLEIPKNVSSIGSGFVFGPNKIKKISVAEGNHNFSSPEDSNVLMQGTKLIFGLSSAKIPAETTIIGSYAFVNCSGLSDVTLPEGVTKVGVRAFAWSGLTSIKMPSTLKTIGNDAFAYCQNLTSVSVEGKTPLAITKNTFTNRANATLNVPAGCKAVYEAADYWKEFKEIIEMEDLSVRTVNVETAGSLSALFLEDEVDPLTITELTLTGQLDGDDFALLRTMAGNDIDGEPTDGMLSKLDISGATIVAGGTYAQFGYHCYLDKEHTKMVPTSVGAFEANSLPESLFAGCQKLKEIKLPSSVMKIGRRAFSHTSLTSFTVPKSTTIIEGEVFLSCPISSFEVEPGNEKYYAEGNAIVELASDRLVLTCNNTIVPSTVKIIGSNAFTNYQGETIALPENLEKIEQKAFTSTAIKRLTIPAKVSSIEGYLFGGCYNLTELKVDANNATYESPEGSNAIIEKSTKTLIDGCQTTVIPSYVKNIGEGAFFSTYSLSAVKLLDGIESIGDYAFAYCSLPSIILPKSIKKLGTYAFYCNLQLKKVSSEILDPSQVTMGQRVFYSISNDAVLEVPYGTSDVYKAAGWDSYFSKIEEMPSENIRTFDVATAGTLSTLISDDDKLSITELTITGYLNGTDFRLIREMAGNDYLGRPTNGVLRKLDISGANIVEGGENYLDTNQITSSTGAYIQDIGENSFHFATQNNVLGSCLFAGCDKLEEIVLPNSTTSIGDYVFWYCLNLQSLEIPKNVSSIGWRFINGPNNISNFSVAEGNQNFSSPEDSNVLLQGTKLILGLNRAIIPVGTTIIGSDAFVNCTGINDIAVPEGVTTIEGGAFAWSSLSNIVLPSTLTTIENDAFAGCYDLYSFTLPKSVVSYGDGSEGGLGALKDCGDLTSIKVEEGNTRYDSRDNCNAIIETATNTLVSGCKNTVIPNTVTIIGHQAFRGINLSDFEIPNGITTIGERAFWSSSLTSVKIPSSVTKIGELAFENCDVLTSVSVDIETPLAITANTFTNRGEATLYVPAGCKAAYEAADYWKEFSSIVEMEPAPTITITAKSYSRAYGEANPTFESDITGGTVTGTPSITCAATATSGVGTYDIVITAGTITDPNVQYVNGTLTVTKAPLKITAKSYTRKQGEENPEFGVTYEGFKNSETDAVLTTKPTVTCAATKDSPVGTYDITVSGAATANYEISYVAGTLTIEAAPAPEPMPEPTPMPEPKGTIFDVNTDDSSTEVKISFVVKESDSTGTPTVAVSDDKDASGSVSIPESVTHNGVEYKVTEIGEGVFQNNTNLTEVKIPASITSIGANAFAGCKNLQAITINIIVPINLSIISARGLTRTESSNPVFEGVDMDKCILYVPEGSVDAYKAAPVWKDFKNIVVIGTATGIKGIEMTAGETFDVFNLNGLKVKSQTTSLDGLPKGIYVVKGKKVMK